MKRNTVQRFELADFLLQYNYETCILLCKNTEDGRNLWIRKIEDGGFILEVLEDDEKIYLNLESGEKSGQFIALGKTDGSMLWYIPGKAFMCRLFLDSVFLIFSDENDDFFLIRVSAVTGDKLWHYRVNNGLALYTINSEKVILKYNDESLEVLDSNTGIPVK